jgi:aryl-alcohol dehydrogenase-like predicted oxidoreductase
LLAKAYGGEMQHRHLGSSGMLVSEISYGNWITHGAQVEADAAKACVHAALECGITTFDTADAYAGTRAEVVLGEALIEAKVKRERVEIATKVFFPTGPGPNNRGLSRKHIMASCTNSLRRLQTDYLDLYQAHRYDYATPLDETMRAFGDLTRQGKIHYVGVSEWTAQQIRDASVLAKEFGVEFVSNQPQYSLLWRVIEAEVVPACEEVGVGQIVWSPIAQGVLTGKYLPGQPVPEGSRATDEKGNGANFVSRFLTDEVLVPVQRAVTLIRDAGLSPAQFAVAWVLRNPNVSSAIIGASRPEQVRDNVGASGMVLDDALVAAVEAELASVVSTDPSLTQSPRQRP